MGRDESNNEQSDIAVFTNGDIWSYGNGFFKAFTEDYEIKKQLEKVGGANQHCLYAYPKSSVKYDGKGRPKRTAWDFVIPSARRKTVEKILKKNLNREVKNNA